MNDRVQVDVTDGIADVRLCRPEKRNALDQPMFEGLVQAGKDLSADPSVRVAILHGEGPAFCSGHMRVVSPDAKLAFVEVNLAMEFECSGALMGTPNQMEAIAASFEKREPRFQDPGT
jgi:enoyl-CoA hydratase/carnithine racemase